MMETHSQVAGNAVDLSALTRASAAGDSWVMPVRERALPAPVSRQEGSADGQHAPPAIRVGDQAPSFTLKTTPDQSISLSDLRGSPVILAFYPADWSPVCGDQMVLYNEVLPELTQHRATILGISVDGIWCHLAFSRDRKLRFPLLADFEPKGAVARAYGVYRNQEGISERALFVIDAEGIVRWTHVSPIGINPGAAGILRALESLQAGAKVAA
jgi:peroxiredoxin